MSELLKSKVAIITGASSGFGKAMAEKFSEAKASCVLISRNEKRLQEVTAQINSNGGNAISVPGDVTIPKTFESAMETALSKWGKIDILINNAGGGIKIAPIDEQTEDSITQAINLNLSSVLNSCRIIVPQMKKQHNGLIVNVSSVCDKLAWPSLSVYSAAKAGVSMFSRCLSAEVRPEGIRVTVIVPAASNTEFGKRAGLEKSDWDESNALRPEHIAHAALSVATLPAGSMIPEISVHNMSQEIIPC